ncbi:MAG TPA: PAS domain-containing protein [Candidatus Ozemobacteraceae bacterium]
MIEHTDPHARPAAEEEDFYQRVFDGAGAGIAVIGPDGRIRAGNQAFGKLLGHSPEAVAGRALNEFLSDEDHPALEALFAEARGTLPRQPRAPHEIRLRRADGTFAVALLALSPLVGADPDGSMIVVVFGPCETPPRICTHAKRAELSDQFQTLLDAAPDRITRLDRDLKLTWANRAAAVIAGQEAGEIIGKTCYEIFFRRSDICPNCPVIRCFESGREVHETMVDRNGNLWDLATAPIRGENGQITEVIEVARDVTRNHQLEHLSAQSQKLDAIGQLAGGVAHDFTNILSAIIGFSELIALDLPPESPSHLNVRQILDAAHRAEELTQNLLVFGRRKAFDRKREDLNSILLEFRPLLEKLVREDITLSFDLAPAPLWIMGNRNQIEQVLMHLATNARDAMPHGGSITFTTRQVNLNPEQRRHLNLPQGSGTALLACTDTGAGIPEALRSKIFEPFFTTKPPGQGSGMGLSAVFAIVRQHQGNIALDTSSEHGTTFHIHFPLTGGFDAEPSLAAAKGAGKVRQNLETILLAEDFPSMRAVTTAVLTRFGYRVIEAVDGVDALEKYDHHGASIDLVILDGVMPRKNGVEVFREIRSRRPSQKILFMTGYLIEMSNLNSLEKEHVSVLLKPVAPSLLLNRVRAILDEDSP